MSNTKYSRNGKGKNYHKKDSDYSEKNVSTSGKEAYPKRGGKPHSERYTRTPVDITKVTTNDPAYYNKNKFEYEQSTKIPWDKVFGDIVPFSDLVYNKAESTTTWKGHSYEGVNQSFPCIMAMDFVPGPGYCGNPQDPVNRAFTQLIGDIYSRTTGGDLGYQEADLAMFLTSTSSIACLIAHLSRALRASSFWISRNITYPRALLPAMGYFYADLAKNINTYAARLNACIRAFNNMKMPNFLDIYPRQFALCNNVYVDEDSAFGQVIFFKPVGVYKYIDTRSSCVWTELPSFTSTETIPLMEKDLGLLEEIISLWYKSSDLFRINGSLQRAYKESSFLTIPEFSTAETLNPVLDRNIMLQVMNASILDYNKIDASSLDIIQDPVQNVVYWKPMTKPGETFDVSHDVTLLRAYDETVSADDNMEMTRLLVMPTTKVNLANPSLTVDDCVNCGPELVVGVNVVTYDREQDFNTGFTRRANNMLVDLTAAFPLPAWSELQGAIASSNIRYFPTTLIGYLTKYGTDPAEFSSITLLGDLYNYTYFTSTQWKQLQTTAMYSLWKVKPSDK